MGLFLFAGELTDRQNFGKERFAQYETFEMLDFLNIYF